MDDPGLWPQLLEAPTAGYEDATVVPEIAAGNLGLSTVAAHLVQTRYSLDRNKESSWPHLIFQKDHSRWGEVPGSHDKPVVAKVSSSTSTPGISSEVAELKDMVKALLLDKKNQPPTPTLVKAVVQPPIYQAPAYQAPAPQIQGVSKEDFQAYEKANDVCEETCITQRTKHANNCPFSRHACQFLTSNTASTSGTLPSNIVTNPKEDLKGITTRSGIEKSLFPKLTSDLHGRRVSGSIRLCQSGGVSKDLSCINGVYEGEITLRVGKEAITFNLDQTSRYTANYNHMTANRIDVIDMDCEESLSKSFGFSNVISSCNPNPYMDPIVSTTSPTLTPFGDSDFLLFKEADSFLAIEDDPTSPEVDLI
ncbi:hypothetical protein Tco_1408744 [Tanacetum coccineum]